MQIILIHLSKISSEMLNILFAASEVVPFAKTGGLADVGNALPKALKRLGHNPCIFLPAYRSVLSGEFELETALDEIEVPVGNKKPVIIVRKNGGSRSRQHSSAWKVARVTLM